MKITAVLTCITLGALSVEAQYKAILATPTPPAATQTGTGDVYAGVELRAVGGGYAYGQYNGRAVKVSLIDGSMTMLDSNAPSSPFDFSAALGTDGTQVVGYSGGTKRTCVRWDANGIPTSYTPGSFQQSACNATDGTLLGGFLENETVTTATMPTPSSQRAVLWTSPTSFNDLHTGGNNFSQVLGMAANQQVGFQSPSIVSGMGGNRYFGYAYATTPSSAMAYLWHGSNSGAVNLNPAGFTSSVAFATNGVQQGGYAYDNSTTPHRHAILWSGTAASAIDLTPPGWWNTEIRALSAWMQAGDGYEPQSNQGVPGIRHALVWSGNTGTMIDLNLYLPPGYTNAVADAIDSSGTVVGHTWSQTPTGFSFAPVIFQPQPASPWQLQSVTLNATEINEGDTVTGQVTLAGPAPAGGQVITLFACFSSGLDMTNLEPVPASITVPEGQTTASFSFITNRYYLTYPTITPQPFNYGGQMWTRIYANDGAVSRFAPLSVDLFPFLRTFSIPSPISGGATATGTLLISGTPWPSGNAVVALTSGNPAVLSLPATATILQGAYVPNASFTVTTAQVAATTVVPVTASINGTSITINVTVNPAPPATLTGISVTQEVVGGNPYNATLTFSGPVPFGGATVSLTSDNPAVVPVPATASAAQGQSSIAFSAVTSVVTGSVTAHITATYNGVSLAAPITVDSEPPVKITVAEYDTISLVAKVEATTNIPNSTLSFGFDPTQGPIGPMTLSNGVWSASVKNLASAPSLITVWNSNGGSVSVAPTLRNK